MWDRFAGVADQVRTITLKGKIYFGPGAVNSFETIAGELKEEGVTRILVVTGRGAYRRSGAWDVIESVLKSMGLRYTLFAGVTPNPSADQVDTAVAMGISAGAQVVVGIGGGSAIDAAKSAAVLLKFPGRKCAELFVPAGKKSLSGHC